MENTRENREAKIEKCIKAVLADSRMGLFGFSNRLQFHDAKKELGEIYITMDEGTEIVRRFKDRGYFAHYCYYGNSKPQELVITTQPTERDI